MKKLKSFPALIMLLSLLVFNSCEDNDDNLSGTVINPGSGNVTLNEPANEFVWRAMNLWYFWQADVPALDVASYPTYDEFYTFLNTYDTPDELFYNICYNHSNIVGSASAIDRFSYITSDYNTLINAQQGVFKSNGLSYNLAFVADNDPAVVGIVRYVDNNTFASNTTVQRGDIFNAVNGTELYYTDETNNNLDLLDPDTYTLNFATLENGQAVSNGVNIDFVKEEVTISPILISKTLDVSGQKIGYLMYNRFTATFDTDLNAAFGQFKADGVTDLILDMRYNPGGSVRSATRLSSMVTGQFTGDVFIKQRYNSTIQQAFLNQGADLNDYFVNNIDGAALNSLNLNRVFIIATDRSASATELVINGLDPKITVTHVGETTVGKNEFSVTLVDDESSAYQYTGNNTGNITPGNLWGLQPLIGRNENSVGDSNYTSGLVPDILIEESLLNLGILGEVDEPLLAEAISQITGVTTKGFRGKILPMRTIMDSNDFTVLKDNMYVDLTDKNLVIPTPTFPFKKEE